MINGDKHSITGIQIYLPIGQLVTQSSRIKLTKRNNATLATVEYYDLVGDPYFLPDNKTIVCDCQSVEVGA